MFFRAFILLVALNAVSVACSQTKGQGDEEFIRAKRRHVEQTRWLFNCWEREPWTTLQRPELQGKPISEYVRTFVTPEQFKVLQAAYDERKQANDELRSRMDTFDVIVRRSEAMSKGGLTEQQASRLFPAPRGFVDPSKEEVTAALRSYIESQDKAEDRWASVVEEVLSPDQFAKFAPFFTKAGTFYLSNPLFARQLGLDKSQVREIEKLGDLYQSQLEQVRSERRSGTEFESPSLRVAYWKPLTVLTPSQLRLLAPVLLKEGDTWKDYRERLSRDEPVSQILTPIVDKIIEGKAK